MICKKTYRKRTLCIAWSGCWDSNNLVQIEGTLQKFDFLKDSTSKYNFSYPVLIPPTIIKEKREQDQFIGYEA